MPVLILNAIPATRTIGRWGASTKSEITTNLVPPRRITAATVPDVANQVIAFGRHVAAACPRQSFVVLARMARGQRKPRGFDAAARAQELNCESWLHVALEQAVPHADGPGVSSWGSKFTPFCLEGHAPVWPGDGPAYLETIAQRSLGLYGWTRAVAFRLAQLTGREQDPAQTCTQDGLRAAYARKLHPFDMATEIAAMDRVARSAAA